MSVQNALNAAIYSRLTGGTTLTAHLTSGTSVYFLQAPDQCNDGNYIVWNVASDLDENDTPSRAKSEMVNIKAVSRTGPAKAGSIDAQIDALLHNSPLTVAGWTNFWLSRETGYQTVDNDAAGKYWQSGAFYRIRLDKE